MCQFVANQVAENGGVSSSYSSSILSYEIPHTTFNAS